VRNLSFSWVFANQRILASLRMTYQSTFSATRLVVPHVVALQPRESTNGEGTSFARRALFRENACLCTRGVPGMAPLPANKEFRGTLVMQDGKDLLQPQDRMSQRDIAALRLVVVDALHAANGSRYSVGKVTVRQNDGGGAADGVHRIHDVVASDRREILLQDSVELAVGIYAGRLPSVRIPFHRIKLFSRVRRLPGSRNTDTPSRAIPRSEPAAISRYLIWRTPREQNQSCRRATGLAAVQQQRR
jgi:hypothetical protein